MKMYFDLVRKHERGVVKICDFCPISRCILVTMRDKA